MTSLTKGPTPITVKFEDTPYTKRASIFSGLDFQTGRPVIDFHGPVCLLVNTYVLNFNTYEFPNLLGS